MYFGRLVVGYVNRSTSSHINMNEGLPKYKITVNHVEQVSNLKIDLKINQLKKQKSA